MAARTSIAELKQRLNDRVEEFCRRYLKGGYRDQHHWRCSDIHGKAPKNKDGDGSFVVDLAGDKVGTMHDFSSGEHGDLLDILKAQFGKGYLQEARDFLGLSDAAPRTPTARETGGDKAPADRPDYLELARKDFAAALPLAGTHAAAYLSGRGIQLDPWPGCFRFAGAARFKAAETYDEHGQRVGPKKYAPALLCRVDDAGGTPLGIQRVFLDPEHPDRKHPKTDHAKKSLGPVKGGSIHLTPPAKVIGVCEGPENGASLLLMALACGWLEQWGLAIWAIPGASNMKALALPDGCEELWIFADNDAPDKRGRRAGQLAAKKLADAALAAGKRVKVIFPKTEGQDWNDLLRKFGADLAGLAVEQLIAAAHLMAPGAAPSAEPAGSPGNGAVAPAPTVATPNGTATGAFPLADGALPAVDPEDPGPREAVIKSYQGLPDFQERFVWVRNLERFYDKRTNDLLSKGAMNDGYYDVYAGKVANDLLFDHETVKVEALTFWPGQGEIIQDQGRRCFNTWVAPQIEAGTGDPAPFLDHLKFLVDGDDTAYGYLLNWFAFHVQHPGEKISSAPMLVGLPGTGKSLLTSVFRAMLGARHVIEITPENLESRFNSFLQRAQLIVVEEMRTDDKWKLMNKLKPWITNEVLEIELKGIDIFTIPNRCNWMFLSNDVVGAVIERADRRYMVWASQSAPKDADYYVTLFGWLRGGGYQVVYNYFKNVHDCSEFNPKAHAPATEPKELVQKMSLGPVHWECQELFEAGEWPFNGDIVLVTDIAAKLERLHPTKRDITLWLHRNGAHYVNAVMSLADDRRGRPWIIRRHEFWKANHYDRDMMRKVYGAARSGGSRGDTRDDMGDLPWGDEKGPTQQ